MKRLPTLFLVLLAVACDDFSPSDPATVTGAGRYVAAAKTEDEAWARAYTWLRATEHPQAQRLVEHMAWAYPDSSHWEFVRSWNAEEAARRLSPRLRCANALREGIAADKSIEEVLAEQGIPATARDTAVVSAMNGVAAYLRGLVEGTDPSPWLLDEMRNLGLPEPISTRRWMGAPEGG